MLFAAVLDALAREPVRALLTALRHGSLDYAAVKAIASGGTADDALKRLRLLGAVSSERHARHSVYDVTRFGEDMLEAIDIAADLKGDVRIFDILNGTGGMLVLVSRMGYVVRDLHTISSSTRANVTRRLRDAGVVDGARHPSVIEQSGYRMLLIHLHLMVRRQNHALAELAWVEATGLMLEPLDPKDELRRRHMLRLHDPVDE